MRLLSLAAALLTTLSLVVSLFGNGLRAVKASTIVGNGDTVDTCQADSTVRLSGGEVLSVAAARRDTSIVETAPVLVDDADRTHVQITAYWAEASSEVCGPYASSALHDGGVRADGVVRFLPDLQSAGRYEVFLHWPSLSSSQQLATNVPVSIRHAGGTAHRTMNMRAAPHRWKSLGTFSFAPEQAPYVEVRNDAVDGHVVADAVLFVPVPRL